MRRAWVAAALAVAALGAAASVGAAAATDAPHGHVVIIGVPGLRWTDVGPLKTPELWAIADSGSVGSVSVRAGRPRTCPVDGRLTLGAGNRARGLDPHPDGCPATDPLIPVEPVGRGAHVDFTQAQRNNDKLHFDAQLGALGTALRDAGDCATAVGGGAVLAAADEEGNVDRVLAVDDVTPAALRRCAVTVADIDPLTVERSPASLAATDAFVGRVADAAPADATVIVVGISEVDNERTHLHYGVIRGPDFPADRLLRSGTTRRAPFVQLIDIAPTALHVLDVDRPPEMVGQLARSVGGAAVSLPDRVRALVDTDRAAIGVSRLVPPFFALVVATQFALYVVAAFALHRVSMGDRWRHRIRRGTGFAALVYAGAPAATYMSNLYPWWRSEHPLVAVLLSELVGVTIIAALALAGPWRRDPLGPAGAVAGATALILAGDIVTGGRLQLSSLLGYSPLVAGRFAGFGNVAFTLFATGALLATAAVFAHRSRRTTQVGVTVVAVACVLIDGGPWFGADFGGVLAIVPSFTVLGMLLVAGRILWGRLIAATAGAVVIVFGLALIDYARPEQNRTHLGRFVAQIRDGTAGEVIHRKADANLHVLTHNILGLMVPVTVLFLFVLLRRPTGALLITFRRVPALRAGLTAVLVLGIVGFAVNDSGIAIPALAMTIAIPIAIAVTMRAVEDEEAERGAAPAESGASG